MPVPISGGVVRMRRTRLTALGLAVLIGFGLLPAASSGATPPDPAPFIARGSVHQVHVVGAAAHPALTLRRNGTTIQSAETDDLGGYLFRNVDAGSGYTVRTASPSYESAPVRVLSATET